MQVRKREVLCKSRSVSADSHILKISSTTKLTTLVGNTAYCLPLS